jgi:hypothetical protein
MNIKKLKIPFLILLFPSLLSNKGMTPVFVNIFGNRPDKRLGCKSILRGTAAT